MSFNFLSRLHWFQITFIGTVITFLSILISVAFIAQFRLSGSTGIDVSKMQTQRHEYQQQKLSKKHALMIQENTK